MLYALIGYDKPNGLAHRMEHRPDHLAHLDSLGDKLVLAGPFLDAKGDMNGKLEAVRKAYRTRFKQESVLVVTQPACVAL